MTNDERQHAIEWFKRRPVTMAGAKRMYDLAVEALKAYVPDTNVGDMISKQDAIDKLKERLIETALNSVGLRENVDETLIDVAEERIERWLDEVPPVQPKRGYWIESHEHAYMGNGVKEWTNWYCSECDAPNGEPTDFCPHCGADMRGETDGQE